MALLTLDEQARSHILDSFPQSLQILVEILRAFGKQNTCEIVSLDNEPSEGYNINISENQELAKNTVSYPVSVSLVCHTSTCIANLACNNIKAQTFLGEIGTIEAFLVICDVRK